MPIKKTPKLKSCEIKNTAPWCSFIPQWIGTAFDVKHLWWRYALFTLFYSHRFSSDCWRNLWRMRSGFSVTCHTCDAGRRMFRRIFWWHHSRLVFRGVTSPRFIRAWYEISSTGTQAVDCTMCNPLCWLGSWVLGYNYCACWQFVLHTRSAPCKYVIRFFK